MEQYPGYNTEFFAVLEGVVTGPLTGLEELLKYHIHPDTPVWYEGLDDWKPAIMAPLTRQLFMPDSEFNLRHIKNDIQSATPLIHSDGTREIDGDAVEPNFRTEKKSGSESAEPVIPETPAAFTPYAPAPLADASVGRRPKTFLVWAIAVTVIFNFVAGIIAIIYSCKVKSKYAQGNVAGAERCSETTQWWIAVGITAGLIFAVAKLFTGTLF